MNHALIFQRLDSLFSFTLGFSQSRLNTWPILRHNDIRIRELLLLHCLQQSLDRRRLHVLVKTFLVIVSGLKFVSNDFE